MKVIQSALVGLALFAKSSGAEQGSREWTIIGQQQSPG
jgi:hypothetical protein